MSDMAGVGARRIGGVLDRLETLYLGAIRGLALIAATLLILVALWLAVSGLYKSGRDAASVREVPATVSVADLVQVDTGRLATRTDAPAEPLARERRYYADFTRRYFALFRDRFEPFRQPTDARLDQKAFEARFVRADARIGSIEGGTLDFAQDRADLEAQLAAMAGSATEKRTLDRLKSYRNARRERVTRTVSGTRSERYCSYFGYYIGECISYATRDVPYRRQVQELRLPAGIVSHADLFAAYQDRFGSLLDERRRSNAATAAGQRAVIVADNIDGSARLWTAVRIVGAFVVLMFLFLLIALERHQRRLARPGGAA